MLFYTGAKLGLSPTLTNMDLGIKRRSAGENTWF